MASPCWFSSVSFLYSCKRIKLVVANPLIDDHVLAKSMDWGSFFTADYPAPSVDRLMALETKTKPHWSLGLKVQIFNVALSLIISGFLIGKGVHQTGTGG